MQDSDLQKAINCVHGGKTKEARDLLESILKTDPHNISAWFWYVETWPSTAQRIQILRACQHANPSDARVKQALEDLVSHFEGTAQPEPKPEVVLPAPAPITPEPVEDLPIETPKPVISAPQISLQDRLEYVSITPKALQAKAKSQPGRRRVMSWLMWAAAAVLLVVVAAIVYSLMNSLPLDPAKYRHESPYEYYLYVPKNYSADQQWPLFIGIHGEGGTGLDCWNWWQSYADREGFILLCPSLADASGGWYQADGETKLFSDINQVRSQYKVRPREFLVGFSAGAQFVQGFTFGYPQYVSGVAVLSSGNFYVPTVTSRGIPFLVAVGDQDDPVRLQGSATFASTLNQNGFDVQYQLLPGVGHALSDQAKQLTIDLYRKAEGK